MPFRVEVKPKLLRVLPFLAFMIVCVVGVTPAAAAPITFSQSLVAAYDIDDNQVGDTICFDTASCQGTFEVSGSLLSYMATSSATQGILSVMGASSISREPGASGDPGPHYVSTESSASFRDQWTIDGAAAGTTGTLSLSFDITGSYEFSGVNEGVSYGLSLVNFTPAVTFDSDNQLPPYTGELTTTFVFGQELDFMVTLAGGSQLWFLEGGGYDGQGSSMDMSHTAVLNAIVVKDASGNVVPFTLSTASNAALYSGLVPPSPQPPTSVPEPATFALTLLGLAVPFANRFSALRKSVR